jgi:hypothetical protein
VWRRRARRWFLAEDDDTVARVPIYEPRSSHLAGRRLIDIPDRRAPLPTSVISPPGGLSSWLVA